MNVAVIFKQILVTDIVSVSCETTLTWMQTLVQLIAWVTSANKPLPKPMYLWHGITTQIAKYMGTTCALSAPDGPHVPCYQGRGPISWLLGRLPEPMLTSPSGHPGTKSSEILIKTKWFSFDKMHLENGSHFVQAAMCSLTGPWEIWFRDHFMYVPCQWETTLQCNVDSHWLGACTKDPWSSSLCCLVPWTHHPPECSTEGVLLCGAPLHLGQRATVDLEVSVAVHSRGLGPSQYKDRLIYVWRFPC